MTAGHGYTVIAFVMASLFSIADSYVSLHPYTNISVSGCKNALVAGKDYIKLMGRIEHSKLANWRLSKNYGFEIYTQSITSILCTGVIDQCSPNSKEMCYCKANVSGVLWMALSMVADKKKEKATIVLWWGSPRAYSSKPVYIPVKIIEKYDPIVCAATSKGKGMSTNKGTGNERTINSFLIFITCVYVIVTQYPTNVFQVCLSVLILLAPPLVDRSGVNRYFTQRPDSTIKVHEPRAKTN